MCQREISKIQQQKRLISCLRSSPNWEMASWWIKSRSLSSRYKFGGSRRYRRYNLSLSLSLFLLYFLSTSIFYFYSLFLLFIFIGLLGIITHILGLGLGVPLSRVKCFEFPFQNYSEIESSFFFEYIQIIGNPERIFFLFLNFKYGFVPINPKSLGAALS